MSPFTAMPGYQQTEGPSQGATPSQSPSLAPQPQRHLFVVGIFRSGTSLLYNFLNLHPQIKLLFEADALSHGMVEVSSWSGGKWWERLDFFNSCILRHKIHIHPPIWSQAHTRREAAEILYRQYGGPQPLYLGEKSPCYYDCLPTLSRQFPQARFIVIWRNPEDVVSSLLHAGQTEYFFRNRSLPLRSLLGFEKLQADVISLRAQGIPLFDLCYEDLVENPETVLKSICHFLELPFDPGMLDLKKADCSMFPPGELHSRAKSGHLNHISRPDPPGLDQIRPKIQCYLSLWKTRIGDQLITRRYWPEASGKLPGSFAIFKDHLDCLLKQLYWEQFVPLIYGILPFFCLRTYRRWRAKH